MDRAAQADIEEMLEDGECPPQEHLREYCSTQPDPEECYARCAGK